MDRDAREVMVCTNPECGRTYRVRNFRAQRTYHCRHCRSRLGFPGEGTEAIMADELAESSGELPAVSGDPAPAGSGPGPRAALTEVEPGGRPRTPGPGQEVPEDQFGRYLDTARIGRGGMGEILRAVDPLLRRTVAIKVLRAGLGEGDFLVQKFLAEAQITGQLEHPNIVPAHELGRTEDGRLYFSMKLVHGKSLAELLGEVGRPDRRRLLEAFLKVCDAVAYAHSRGVVHRDLKPANIMLGEFGEVLVMDWGIAKILPLAGAARASVLVDARALEEGHGAVPEGEESSGRTMEGAILGTPSYMPPEQASGEVDRIEPRSDVYSLGAILYEILTGTPPYSGGGARATLDLVLLGRLEPPSSRAPEAGVPRELDAVVKKAMAVRKADRYPTVPELASDVRAYLEGFSVSAHQDSLAVAAGKWIRRNRAASAGIAVGLLALVLGLVLAAGLQRARTARRADDLVRRAAERLAEKDYEGAQTDATQALALDPEHPEAAEVLGKAAGSAQEARRRREVAGRVRALEIELAREIEGVDLGETDRRTRFEGLTRALLIAREIVRLAPGEPGHERALAERARKFSGALAEEGNYDMAGLMLDEARASGLEPAIVEMERWRIEEARGEGLRQAKEAIERTRAAVPTPEAREAMLDGLLRTADDQSIETLIPGLFGYPLPFGSFNVENWTRRWESRRLVVEALARIGDARATALVSPDWLMNATTCSGHGTSGLVDPDTKALLAKLEERWFPGREPARVDATQAMAMTLLVLELGPARALGVGIAEALGQFADPRGDASLNARRWQTQPGSSFWLRTAGAYARIPLPDRSGEEEADAEARFWRARALLGKGRSREAKDEFDEAERLGAGEERSYALLCDRALARIESGDLAGARLDLDLAIRSHPDRAEAHYRAGLLALATGDPVGARGELEKARGMAPGDARIPFALARCHEASGAEDLEIEALSLAVSLDPQLAPACVRRGSIRLARGEADGAVADAARALLADPALASGHVLSSEAHRALGEPSMALEDAWSATVLAPDSRDAFVCRARAYVALAEFKQAIQDFRRALDLDPGSPEIRLELALACLEQGRLGEHDSWNLAFMTLDELIEAFPDRADLHWHRGVAHAGSGHHQQAIADLDRVIQIDPRHALALVERGALLMGQKRAEEARRDLEAARELDPENARASRLLALLAAATRDAGLARERARAALSVPQGPSTGAETRDERSMDWLELGVALEALGCRDEALGALERARGELPPSVAAEVDERIARLEGGK